MMLTIVKTVMGLMFRVKGSMTVLDNCHVCHVTKHVHNTGSLICLHDATHAQLDIGFESPWVFGAIQGLPHHEAGFHIFPMKVYLYTIT